MRFERVKIKRDTNTVHNRAVPPWEIPILEWIFDEGNIERLGSFEDTEHEYPDAAQELNRLERCYGSDPKNGVPHANSVYGNAHAGVRTLRKMIEDAKAQEAEAAGPKRRRQRRTADSLLN